MKTIAFGVVYPDPPGVACRTCNDRGYIVLDIMQVVEARLRWQWADLDHGVNDCPKCKQVPSWPMTTP